MTLGQYWSIMQKQWKLIIACFLCVGLGAFVASQLITPIYQSTVLIVITIRSSTNQADYNSLLASDQLVQTEAQLAISDPVLREVASHYPGLTVDQLARQVTSTTKLNTQLFEIDVQDPSPSRAATLANDIANTLIKQQHQITQQDNGKSQQQIQQDLDVTRQQIDGITTQISMLKGQGGRQAQIAVLQEQLDGLQQHYNQWQNALAQLELAEAEHGDFLRIAQLAQPGTFPVRPQIPLTTAVGLVAGLLLGMLLAVCFEHFDTRIRTPEALSQLLSCPILATICLANPGKGDVVVNPQGQSANAEAYRILRTNVGFSEVNRPVRSIIVTSAVSGEGKSTVAANLAIFMAKAGKDTLLIDANLRHPSLYQQFGLSADRMGLSNAVMSFSRRQFSLSPQVGSPASSGASLDPYMHLVGIPNLRIMPSGPLPPNPPELLDSKAMGRFFLAIARCRAEVIIIDTPPLLGLSDTSILASKVEATLLVTDITCANKGELRQAKTLLQQTGTCILGCVVNKENQHRTQEAYFSNRSIQHQSITGSFSMKSRQALPVPFTAAPTMIAMPPKTQSR